jgi:hypothetical protein
VRSSYATSTCSTGTPDCGYKAAEQLTDRQWRRLEATWTAGDPHDEVYNAWAVKELLRDVDAATTVHDAQTALGEFYD